MTLTAGTQLGPYEIIGPLGAGGMGEVYRARDTRLNREVAIKILPADFASDADRLRRFEQEARATSALNHPNILTVHDFGTHEGAPYIVAELLEGEELRVQLSDGALAPRKAIDYAQQLAAGLAAAHGKGVTHRDLKPENLFITTDGRVKILDFGLAKLRPQRIESAGSGVATQKAITDAGTVMGTVGYMSPEQVQGHEADHRSDIFSFGVIFYEMLSGKRTFTGDSAIEVMNAILKEDPAELSETNARINPALEKIVRRCLEKKPERRFHSAHDLCFAIEALSTLSGSRIEPAAAPAVTDTTGKSRLFGNVRLWMGIAALLSLALLIALPFAITHLRHAAPAEPIATRFTIAPPEKAPGFGQLAISPDGRSLVFVATIEGKAQLWLRSMGSFTARPLPGTEGVSGFPFWSPDSRSVCFPTEGKLKKLDLADRTQQTLYSVPATGGSGAVRAGIGGTWNREGVILFFRGTSGIFRMSDAGGEPAPVPGVDQPPEGILYRWPHFLPDGHHFLYLATTTSPRAAPQEKSEVYLASLDGKESRRLLLADSNAMYAAAPAGGGYLLFAREGALVAQRFDASSLTLKGDPFRVADQVRVNNNNRGLFDVSDNGALVYDPTSATGNSQLVWIDRAGKQLETIASAGTFQLPALSPDDKRLAVARQDPKTGNSDIYVIDLVRGATSRLTFDSATDNWPIWSPDGNRIAWGANRGGSFQLYQKLASGAGEEELLLQSSNQINPSHWSSDGRYILYREIDPKTKGDLWVLPLNGDRKPIPFLHGPFVEQTAHFSPDDRWIVYGSDESGSLEVYVQTFPASGGKWLVSAKGGTGPLWRGDGKELFYISTDGKLMTVEVTTRGTFERGIPRALFDFVALRRVTGGYAVTADGQRFLFITQMEETGPSSLAVVVNWTAELKKN